MTDTVDSAAQVAPAAQAGPTAGAPAERNVLLDVLRGLSITLVVFAHYSVLPATFEPTHELFSRTIQDIGNGMGYYGVSVFFAISGFLITSISLKRYGALSRMDFSGFWWMRFSRLVPMMLLAVAMMVCLHSAGVRNLTFTDPTNLGKSVAAMFSFHFGEVMGCDPGISPWNPIWSLSVEELFYLVLPIVGLFLNGPGAVTWIAGLVLSTAIYFRMTGYASPYSPTGCMDQLLVGCLVALARPVRLRETLPKRLVLPVGLLALALGLFVIAFSVFYSHPFRFLTLGPLICSLGAASFIVATQLVDVPRAVRIALWPISILGVISYELYLTHIPIETVLYDFWCLNVFVIFLIAVIVALGVHLLFSEPANRLLRSLMKPKGGAGGGGGDGARRRWRLSWTVLGMAAVPLILIIPPILGARARGDHAHEVVQVQAIADLPVGTVEPLAYIGTHGGAEMVVLRHDADGKIAICLEHWGAGRVCGPELDPAEVLKGRIIISLSAHGAAVRLNNVELAKHEYPPQTPYGRMVVGRNDIGFGTTFAEAKSTFIHVEER